MASALPPLPVNSSANDRRRSTRRAPSTTLAPCAERSRAAASPSPLLAPVMTTTFPSMLLFIILTTACRHGGIVLFVADLFHPVGGLSVELFLNGNVRHGRGCRGAVPMLLTRREPDHVTRPYFLGWASPTLCQAVTRCHNQGLAQRVGVPCGTGARLKRDTGADRPRWIVCLEQGVNAHGAGEILRSPFCGRLRTASFDVHFRSPFWL